MQRSFVEQAVHAQWILKRNTNRYNELEHSLEAKSVLEWTEEDHKKFEPFTQLRQLCKRLDRERKPYPSLKPTIHARAVKPTSPVLSACSDDNHAVADGHIGKLSHRLSGDLRKGIARNTETGT